MLGESNLLVYLFFRDSVVNTICCFCGVYCFSFHGGTSIPYNYKKFRWLKRKTLFNRVIAFSSFYLIAFYYKIFLLASSFLDIHAAFLLVYQHCHCTWCSCSMNIVYQLNHYCTLTELFMQSFVFINAEGFLEKLIN